MLRLTNVKDLDLEELRGKAADRDVWQIHGSGRVCLKKKEELLARWMILTYHLRKPRTRST